jgi:hypothetical protein
MKGNRPKEKLRIGQCMGRALTTNKPSCSGPHERDGDGNGVRVGAPFEDSRLNPQMESWTSTGGDDTILTPFFFSPSCDSAIDSLPELFLAYCTIHDMDA